MSVGIDYELRRPFQGARTAIVQELSGDLQIEYEKMSADRITLSFPLSEAPQFDLYPLAELTLYTSTPSGTRIPFARGWLMRRHLTTTLAVYEFWGARRLLGLPTVQAIFAPTQTVREALQSIIERAQQVLASQTNGVNIGDWQVGLGVDAPAPLLRLLSPVSALSAIQQLEEAYGDRLTVCFGFAPVADSQFTVTAQHPPTETLLLDSAVTEWDERYDGVFNRVRYLMTAPAIRNVIANPDFADALVTTQGEGALNLVPNPSFEAYMQDWTPPQPPIYYEWDWNYGYTGTRNFKFHDCHEYSANGWLTSAFFAVLSGASYAGGFALGCDPWLAQECGGPSTVKVRVQVLGFDAANTQTEIAYDQEITGIFHDAFHWHWVSIPTFRFTNANTVKARIRFNTFHGKRLYLDEVRIHRAYEIYQRDWVLQPDDGSPPLQPGTHFSVDWLRPLGVSEGKHVLLSLALPSGRWVELQSVVNELQGGEAVYVLTLFSAGATPSAFVDWYNEQRNFISTSTPTLSVQDTLNEDGITWTRRTSGQLVPPSNARAARVRLRWTAVTDQSRIRYVALASSAARHPERYGFSVTDEYRASELSYSANVDPELRGEAQQSENQHGILPAIRVREWVIDATSAQLQAEADFLRFAIPERRIVAEGATLDYRLLYPHRYRLRVPSVLARSLLLLSLTIRANGQWSATLGTPQPDLAQLLSYLLQHQQSKH